MSINLGDLAKDCCDALRQSTTYVDEILAESSRRHHLSADSPPPEPERINPAIFRFAGIDSIHTCVYCGRDRPMASLIRFEFLPCYFAAGCAECVSCVDQ